MTQSGTHIHTLAELTGPAQTMLFVHSCCINTDISDKKLGLIFTVFNFFTSILACKIDSGIFNQQKQIHYFIDVE